MTTENNKIIDEFNNDYLTNLNGFKCYYNKENRSYHNDWNLLMEVVEKIEGLHVANNVFIASNTIIHIHNKYTNELDVFIGKQQFANVAENKKENTYNACLDFIKWYNEQKTAKEN